MTGSARAARPVCGALAEPGGGTEHKRSAAGVVGGRRPACRHGCVVLRRTLRRFASERRGFGRKYVTTRIADGDPGAECQVDLVYLGKHADADDGRRRQAHALISSRCCSKHKFVWLFYSQTSWKSSRQVGELAITNSLAFASLPNTSTMAVRIGWLRCDNGCGSLEYAFAQPEATS